MKGSNIWKSMTIILAVIFLFLLFYSIQIKPKQINVGNDFTISEKDLSNFADVFGGMTFRLCSLEANKCYLMRKGVK